MMDRSRLLALVDALAGRAIVIAGDAIADEFIYGRIARVSREAPVLILNYDSTELVPGGAGNAAANVAALGAEARLAAVTGRDETGARLVAALRQRSVDVRGMLTPGAYRTPTKTRILAGGVHSAKQQVVRIDRAADARVDDRARRAFDAQVLRMLRRADGLILSDYGSGLVTPSLVRAARLRLRRRPSARALSGRPDAHDAPVVVDSRYGLLHFRGMTACTPNESEVEQALGIAIGDNVKALERAGRELLRRTRAAAVLVTRGSRGMALFERGRAPIHIPIVGSDQIADVTGAGDTVIAVVTLALSAGATAEEAAQLANHAGAIVVMKRGTAIVTAAELRASIQSAGGAGGRTLRAR
jgi:rfaE bifunctional protein kinase chain/domain